MPYKDPEKRKAYDREYKRVQRAGESNPSQALVPLSFRLKTAQDILSLLENQINAVHQDKTAGTLEKARTIGYLASITLKAVEISDMAARIEALESVLKGRKSG